MAEGTDLTTDAYKALLDHGVDIVTMIDEEGFVTYQSSAVTEILGYLPEELLGQHIFSFLHPDDVELATQSFAKLLKGNDIDRIVVRFKHKSGEWYKVEVVARVYEHQGKTSMILNTRDVTEQQGMLEKLQASERLLQAAFNSTGTMCSVTDLNTGEFIDVNDAFVQGLGWSREEAIGRTALDLNIWGSDSNREKVVNKVRINQSLRQYPCLILTRDDESLSVLLDAEIIRIEEKQLLFVSVVDITEHERLEAQLRQAQRLEAVGQLTSGVAHDLNNMLTVILGQIDLSIDKKLSHDAYRQVLSIIRRATKRGSDLIQQLMIFSRRQTLKPQVLNIADSITNLLTLLEGSLGGEIKITANTEAETWDSYLDESLLENALLNLALNARDAMPQGGSLQINVANSSLDPSTAQQFEVAPGDFVKLSVVDDGIGMDQAIIDNAFEPFFTTKKEGQGTGMGLSMVFGFVKQSGGHIEITSEPGSGTEVTLYFPRSKKHISINENEVPPRNLLEGKTILLIEDNDELRLIVKLLLNSFGCHVIESAGEEIGVIHEPLDLILSDVVLPGQKQGPELVALVKERVPHARVVFMSGYPRDRLSGELLLGDSNLLKKPFSRDQLQQKLNDALTS